MLEVYKAKWILPGNQQALEDKALVVEEGKIVDIIDGNSISDILGDKEYQLFSYGNSIITPGFINAHTHLQYTDVGKVKLHDSKAIIKKILLSLKKLFLVGYIPKEKFIGWYIEMLKNYICWDKKTRIKSFKNGLEMSITSGTTCVAQVSREKEFVEILNSSPIKSYIFIELFSDEKKSNKKAFRKLRKQIRRFIERRNNNTYFGLEPNAIYSVHSRFWEVLSKFSQKHNVLMQTCLGESIEEVEWLKKGSSDIDKLYKFIDFTNMRPSLENKTPVEYLNALKVLNSNLIAVHVNQLFDKELEMLASKGVSVVHCPRSNQKLHKKTVNIFKLLKFFPEKSAIATDSLASNDDLSLLNEVRYIKKDKDIDTLKLLDMITINPAKMLRLDNLIGSLDKGKDADFLVFKLDEGKTYKDLFEKSHPDYVFVQGNPIVKNKNLLIKI